MKRIKRIHLLMAAYTLMLLDGGGFKEHTVCFILLTGLLLLINDVKRKGTLRIADKKSQLGAVLVGIGGVISAFAGIDWGESIFGLLRLMAIMVLGISLQQLEEEEKACFLRVLPITGLLSLAGCLFHDFPFFEDWVSVSGRVNGLFGYANTMALFLILGIVIEEHYGGRKKRVLQIALVFGLFATGSRTAFVIFGGYLVYLFLKDRKKGQYLLIAFLGMTGVIGLVSLAGGDTYSLGRFLKIGLSASTLQGRFLYWEDAIRMYLKCPAGLGYMGYFYFQQAHQTGVYSVRFVHNEWLQWVLDYGLIAGAGLMIYLYYRCRRSNMSNLDKEILGIVAIYSFFDFHLQFWSIVVIVLMALPKGRMEICFVEKKKTKGWNYGLWVSFAFAICLCVSTIIADYYAGHGNYEQAVKWNPLSADYKQEYLLQSKDLKAAETYADRLLAGNKYLYTAYLMKSNAAAQEGHLDDFIVNRRKVLNLRQYKLEEYEDYLEILYSWYKTAYEERNWNEIAVCRMAVQDVPNMLTEVRRKTGVRAYRIMEKPDLTLDQKYIDMITEIETPNR
ncbi:MAG: O-antigen ligase family protein [Lachnospiraceae bacterium]|nr:O-antigen ligase family protein [Lachnospiraceae bacterium]